MSHDGVVMHVLPRWERPGAVALEQPSANISPSRDCAADITSIALIPEKVAVAHDFISPSVSVPSVAVPPDAGFAAVDVVCPIPPVGFHSQISDSSHPLGDSSAASAGPSVTPIAPSTAQSMSDSMAASTQASSLAPAIQISDQFASESSLESRNAGPTVPLALALDWVKDTSEEKGQPDEAERNEGRTHHTRRERRREAVQRPLPLVSRSHGSALCSISSVCACSSIYSNVQLSSMHTPTGNMSP